MRRLTQELSGGAAVRLDELLDLRLSREVHSPVGLPDGAVVCSECLLPAQCVGAGTGPKEASLDCNSVLRVIRVEAADAIFETDLYRHLLLAREATIQLPDGPSTCLFVESAQGKGANFRVWEFEPAVFKIAAAAKYLMTRHLAIKLSPVVTVTQALVEATMFYEPVSDNKVEVIRS